MIVRIVKFDPDIPVTEKTEIRQILWQKRVLSNNLLLGIYVRRRTRARPRMSSIGKTVYRCPRGAEDGFHAHTLPS